MLSDSRQNEKLRREILEATASGHEKAKFAQEELDNQGKGLRESLGQAESVARQTIKTAKAIKGLVREAKLSRTRKALRCCCPSCCVPATKDENDLAVDQTNLAFNPLSLSEADESDVEKDTLLRLESLKQESVASKRATASWKRTLVPPPSVINDGSDIWYKQMDVSLSQLQRMAEDMSRSLDEQLKLAQLLTIYLNYGVDQVMGANKFLIKEKDSF